MKILVSACLVGENCKYSGGNNYNEAVMEFLRGNEVIPVCPEVLGGLPIPRAPAEIVNGIVTNAEGTVVDRQFRAGAERALEIALERGAELAVLQSRSPSCGGKEIYDGSFSRKKNPRQRHLCPTAGGMRDSDFGCGGYIKNAPGTAASGANFISGLFLSFPHFPGTLLPARP